MQFNNRNMIATLNNYWHFDIKFKYIIKTAILYDLRLYIHQCISIWRNAIAKYFFQTPNYRAVSISLPILVIFAEVTQNSFGVGYEIGRAVALNKLVICPFRSDSQKSKSLNIAFACLRLHLFIKCVSLLIFKLLYVILELPVGIIYNPIAHRIFTIIISYVLFFNKFQVFLPIKYFFVLQGYHQWSHEL